MRPKCPGFCVNQDIRLFLVITAFKSQESTASRIPRTDYRCGIAIQHILEGSLHVTRTR